MLMSYSPQLQLLRDALAQLEYHANARAKRTLGRPGPNDQF